MDKEFVPYEQAIELKELGFDNPCFGYYGENQKLIWKSGYAPWTNSERNLVDNHFTAAPLKQQAFRWFREKYNLLGIVGYCDDNSGKFMSVIDKINSDIDYDMNAKDTYEEAELACLDRLIKITKDKK
jgi:hypothetical protein